MPQDTGTQDPVVLARDYAELALGFTELKKTEKALGYWRRSLELEPRYDVHAYNLSLALAKEKKYQEALQILDLLTPNEEDSQTLLELRAFVLASLGNREESLQVYESILTTSGPSYQSIYNSILLQRQLKVAHDPILLRQARDLYGDKKEMATLLLAINLDEVEAIVPSALRPQDLDTSLVLLGLSSKAGNAELASKKRLAKLLEQVDRVGEAFTLYKELYEADGGGEYGFKAASLIWATDYPQASLLMEKVLAGGFSDTAIMTAFKQGLDEEGVMAFESMVEKAGSQGSATKEPPKSEAAPL